MTSQSGSVTSTIRPRVCHVSELGRRSRTASTHSEARTKPAAGTVRRSGTNTPQPVSTRQSAPHPAPICTSGGMRRPTNPAPANKRMTAIPQVVATPTRSAGWGRYSVVTPAILLLARSDLRSRKGFGGPAYLPRLKKYPVDRKLVQAGAGQDMNLASARRAPARIRAVEKQYDDRVATGRRDVRGAGVVPNGESGSVGKIDQAGEFRAADEVDRDRTGRTDFGRERLLARTADDDRETARCVEQSSGQFTEAPCGPALLRMTRRRAGNQQKEGAMPQSFRQGPGRCRAGRQGCRVYPGHQQLFGLLVNCVLGVAPQIGMGVCAMQG